MIVLWVCRNIRTLHRGRERERRIEARGAEEGEMGSYGIDDGQRERETRTETER